MGIAVDLREDRTVFVFEGAVDIGSAAELKAELLKAIDAGRPLGVSLQAATYLDVTAVQLLWAAERMARQSAVQFSFRGAIPVSLCARLAESGFSGFTSMFQNSIND